jgi:hypothetical protein
MSKWRLSDHLFLLFAAFAVGAVHAASSDTCPADNGGLSLRLPRMEPCM